MEKSDAIIFAIIDEELFPKMLKKYLRTIRNLVFNLEQHSLGYLWKIFIFLPCTSKLYKGLKISGDVGNYDLFSTSGDIIKLRHIFL